MEEKKEENIASVDSSAESKGKLFPPFDSITKIHAGDRKLFKIMTAGARRMSKRQQWCSQSGSLETFIFQLNCAP